MSSSRPGGKSSSTASQVKIELSGPLIDLVIEPHLRRLAHAVDPDSRRSRQICNPGMLCAERAGEHHRHRRRPVRIAPLGDVLQHLKPAVVAVLEVVPKLRRDPSRQDLERVRRRPSLTSSSRIEVKSPTRRATCGCKGARLNSVRLRVKCGFSAPRRQTRENAAISVPEGVTPRLRASVLADRCHSSFSSIASRRTKSRSALWRKDFWPTAAWAAAEASARRCANIPPRAGSSAESRCCSAAST